MRSRQPRKLVEILADGSLEELLSPLFCAEIERFFVGNKAVIIRSPASGAPTVLSSGVEAGSVQAYEQHFFAKDPMSSSRSSNNAMRMSDAVSKKKFEASEFYNDFFKPMNSYHSLSIARSIGGGDSLEIAVNRDHCGADFCDNSKKEIKRLTACLAARIGVLESKNTISANYRAEKLAQVATLTERELEVFVHVSSGLSLEDFSTVHNISMHTARTLLKNTRMKLHAESQLELARVARALF